MKQLFTLVSFLFTVVFAQAQVSGTTPDIRANETYSKAVSISVDNLSVYPNPALDNVKLTLRISQDVIAKVFIINNIGIPKLERSVELQQGVNSLQVNLRENGIGRGIYFLVVEAGDIRLVRKLVVK